LLLMKTINEKFTEEEYQNMKDAKGNKTWREAILENFGVR